MCAAFPNKCRLPALRAPAQALPLQCQCLFLRLFQRKGPLFRLASLAYKEVPDATAAAAQLAAAGLAVVTAPPEASGSSSSPAAGGGGAGGSGNGASSSGGGEVAIEWHQLADLLTVPELTAVLAARRFQLAGAATAGLFRGGGGGGTGALRNRQQLLEALERGAAPPQLVPWLLQATGPVLQLAAPACEAMERLQRLFFLNEGQSLSQVHTGIEGGRRMGVPTGIPSLPPAPAAYHHPPCPTLPSHAAVHSF